MKKIWLALAVLGVFLAAAWFLMHQKNTAAVSEYAQYLPENTVAVVELKQLNTVIDRFPNSVLGRFFAQDRMRGMMSEMGASLQAQQDYEQLYESIAQTAGNPVFRSIFGEESILALLPLDAQALRQNPQHALRKSLVLFATAKASSALDLVSGLIKGASISKEKVGDLELRRIQLDQGKETFFAYADQGQLLFAYQPEAISACMTTRRSGKSLLQREGYKVALQFWQPFSAERVVERSYLNLSLFRDILAQLGDQEDLREAVALLAGMDDAFSLTQWTDKGIESKARTRYQRDQLHALVKSAVDSATTNPSLHLMSEKTLFYEWGLFFRPETLVEMLAKQDAATAQQVNSWAQQELGLPSEEIAAAFGPQYGMLLEGFVKSSLFSIPDFTMFTNLRNRPVVVKLVDKLRQESNSAGLRGEEETPRAGVALYSWPIAAETGFIPALALDEERLYFGSMKNSVRNLTLNQANPKASALPAAVAQKLGASRSQELSKANAGLLIMYPARLAQEGEGMLDSLGAFSAVAESGSWPRLAKEVLALMREIEVLSAAQNLSSGYADWDMNLEMRRPEQAVKK